MVLEKVHGTSYPRVIAARMQDLALPHTRCDDSRERIPGRAQGYDFEDGVRRNDAVLGMSQPGAAGMMLSTGEDLVRWSMALAGGKVVKPESYVAMTTSLVLKDGRDTGYGFGLMKAELAGEAVVLHGGGIHGCDSQLLHVVPDDLHVAVISNCTQASADRLARDIVRTVLGIEKTEAKDLPIPADVAAAAAGTFTFAAIGMDLAITAKDGKLFASGQAEGQGRFRLLFQDEREFRAAFDPDVELVFGADWKTVTLHQGPGVFAGTRQ